jgi:hypothetical protein
MSDESKIFTRFFKIKLPSSLRYWQKTAKIIAKNSNTSTIGFGYYISNLIQSHAK